MHQPFQFSRTGLVLSDEFCAHEAQDLPELPARIKVIRAGLSSSGLLSELTPVAVPELSDTSERSSILGWIKTNHAPEYIAKFEKAFQSGAEYITSHETPLSQATFDVTWRATGAVLNAVTQVARGDLKNAFCAVRPPGHHAEFDGGSGFCYVNHIAVAARYLLLSKEGFLQPDGSRLTFDRVMIVDIDLHHGNGAQHSFWNDDKVMFCSLHGHPDHLTYPGTGHTDERGKNGNILNIPFVPGSSASDYMREFEQQFLTKAQAFKPQFILVSSGFDTHKEDPLNYDNAARASYMELAIGDFGRISRLLVDLSNHCCDGRLVSILEGGYNLKVLGPSVAAHVRELLG